MSKSIKNLRVLSIDAWKEESAWTWNNWFYVGSIEFEEFKTLDTNRKFIKWFRESGYITENSKGMVAIDDDQYNIVLVNKNTQEPLFAIEYGNIEG